LTLDAITPAHVRALIAHKLSGQPCAKHDRPDSNCDACAEPPARNTVKSAAATLRAVLYQAQIDPLIATAWNGYLLTVACRCGVVFERWLTPEDAGLDMFRAAQMNWPTHCLFDVRARI
jgi:hypothetical protein